MGIGNDDENCGWLSANYIKRQLRGVLLVRLEKHMTVCESGIDVFDNIWEGVVEGIATGVGKLGSIIGCCYDCEYTVREGAVRRIGRDGGGDGNDSRPTMKRKSNTFLS